MIKEPKHGKIQNCTLAYNCPLKWKNLDKIKNNHDKRYCSECDTIIYKIETLEDLEKYKNKKCVYLPYVDEGIMGTFMFQEEKSEK